MPARPVPRTATVIETHPFTRNMHRVVLGGPGLADFPADQAGGYIKLMLPAEEGSTLRTYTIRDQAQGRLIVDFALHGEDGAEAGPATRWALAAKPGDTIMMGGPGPAKPLPGGFDFYLVAGDMTALPAIGANLERLDRDAKGAVFIEIQHEDDRQDIDAPEGVAIHWIVNPEPGLDPSRLTDAVCAQEWPQGRVYGWAASEFNTMRALRSYLREERSLSRDELYISSYWKSGLAEEAHKAVKRQDAEMAA